MDMKMRRNCKWFDRVSSSIGSCTYNGEVVGVNNSCDNYDERKKIPEDKLLEIAKEAVRLYFECNYTEEEAIKKAKEIYGYK